MNSYEKEQHQNLMETAIANVLDIHMLYKKTKEISKPFLWTEQDLILPLFDTFMVNSKSIVRFVKMFDSDPGYYLEQAHKKCPFFDKLLFYVDADDVESWTHPLKAFACHYSERESDIAQLSKFYRKNMAIVLNHFPNEIPEKMEIDFQVEVLFYRLFLSAGKKNQNSNIYIPFDLGLSVLAVYMHRQHPIRINPNFPDTVMIYEQLMSSYYFRAGITPPEIMDAVDIRKITSHMVKRIFAEKQPVPVQVANTSKYVLLGDSVWVESFLKEIEQECSELSPQEITQIINDIKAIATVHYSDRAMILQYVHGYLNSLGNKQNNEKEPVQHSKLKIEDKPEQLDMVPHTHLVEKMAQLEQANNKLVRLQFLVNQEKETTRELRGQLSSMQEELDATKIALNDAIELLNGFGEDHEKEMENPELTDEEKNRIQTARVLIVGGHCHLHRLLSEIIPELRFLGADPSAVDSQTIRSVDLICYLPHYLSHAMFKTVKGIANAAGIKQVYHGTNNVNFICKTIAKGLSNT